MHQKKTVNLITREINVQGLESYIRSMIYAGLLRQIRCITISQQNKNVAAFVCKNEIFDSVTAILISWDRLQSLLTTEKSSAKHPKHSQHENNCLASLPLCWSQPAGGDDSLLNEGWFLVSSKEIFRVVSLGNLRQSKAIPQLCSNRKITMPDGRKPKTGNRTDRGD